MVDHGHRRDRIDGLGRILRFDQIDQQGGIWTDAFDDRGYVVACNHLARIDNPYLVAHIGKFGQDVARDDDRLAHRTEPAHQGPHFDTGSRVQSAQWLIQKQNGWIVQKRSSQSESLGLAAREGVGIGIAFEVQVDDIEHFVAAFASCLRSDTVSRGEKL